MGFLGIIFEIDLEFSSTNILELKNKSQFILLFENKNSIQNIILGFKPKLSNIQSIPKYYIDTDFKLQKAVLTNNFSYSSIKTANYTINDYDNVMFWFKPEKYLILREKTEIKTDYTIENLVDRISKIIEILQTNKRF